MPAVEASLEYLQKLPLYEEEKPYWCFLPPHEGFDPDVQRVDNLEFEHHRGITIQDIREWNPAPQIEECGFQVLSHRSNFRCFQEAKDVEEYRLETEQHLKEVMEAAYVKCYDSRLRKNVPFERSELDLNDLLMLEGPARGAHNEGLDITIVSGPEVITRYLPMDVQKRFLCPGYRFRIVKPLALCDSRSVDPDDLVAADRIIPNGVGEVYYLTHSPKHKWFWLEKQTPSELLAFVMYDTKPGSHARFCPHVSFVNPRSPEGASPRESIETRSIVITRERDEDEKCYS
ncbi:uncharacterized protein PAC_05314 [Phialocephala subalpina]|uniref:7alpha-cephem-methoxylase P8 chain n=1 Tax=Phialocephala subalpina TaxID=576137 RepID=A0A1L7WRM7_9HELO|nr:uncharacterized protein PAC_05314 [Phialocephala subalpina]